MNVSVLRTIWTLSRDGWAQNHEIAYTLIIRTGLQSVILLCAMVAKRTHISALCKATSFWVK